MLANYSQEIINNHLGRIQNIESRKLEYLYHLLNSKKYKIYNLKINQCVNTFPKNDFISPILLKKTKEYQNCINITWLVKHTCNVNCDLYFYTKSFNDLDHEYTQNLIQKLIRSISFISSFQNKNHSYKIHFVPLNESKKFKKSTRSFTRHLINSGCSANREKDSTIFVWRIEEFIKVIFHEFIHSFINHGNEENENTSLLLKKYKKRYNLYSREIDFFESYCEIWGRILNCFYIASRYPVNNPYQYFCRLLSLEIFYSHQKSLQILELKETNNILVDDHTNITAYYLITSEIFSNLNNFLKEFYPPNLINLKEFYEFLLSLKKIKKKNIIIKDNYLRMTCMELKLIK